MRPSKESLLQGARGRRLLLEYVLESELTHNQVRTPDTLGYAIVDASRRLDGTGATQHSSFGWLKNVARTPQFSVTEIVERLRSVCLVSPTPVMLRNALRASVDSARPWQVADGEDQLLTGPEMRAALEPAATLVASSPFASWWQEPAPLSVQWVVGEGECGPETDVHYKRIRDAPNSGDIWQLSPPSGFPSSTRLLADSSPAGLWFREDDGGEDYIESFALHPDASTILFEITSRRDWQVLCERFPRDVTAVLRQGRSSSRRWIMPDWEAVATQYDGVHLQVQAYLTAAGATLPIDESSNTASMISGWNPDETYWFSRPRIDTVGRRWKRVVAAASPTWEQLPRNLFRINEL